ncbi:MAG: hypothetical protein LBU32_17155 [Clostridiales bacterium]|nr:hypothetical protein [Clostridiales bacterium]
MSAYPKALAYETADAGLQRAPEDIRHVAQTLKETPDSLALGVRTFDGRDALGKSK